MTSVKLVAFICCVTAAIASQSARGEPSSAVRYLMNEPATLFDLGMQRLQSALEASKPGLSIEGIQPELNQYYTFSRNELGIGLTYDLPLKLTLAQAKAECRRIVGLVREELMVDATSGKPHIGLGSLLGAYFSHSGGAGGRNEPESVSEQLDAMTVIKVSLGQSGKKLVACNARLLGTEVSFDR